MSRGDVPWSVPSDPTVLLDALKVAVIVTDLAGTVVECNRQAEILYGVSRESLLGLSSASFAIDDLPPDVMATIGRALSENKTWEGDFAIRRRSGEFVMVHVIDSAVLDDAGRLCGVVSASIDITDRWRAERRVAVERAVSQVLANAESLDEATGELLRVVSEELGWDAAGWWEPDETGVVLRCRDFWIRSSELREFAEVSHTQAFEMEVGLPGRVWQTSKAVWVPDVTADANFPRARGAAAVGLHAALAVPLVSTSEVIGVMEFFGSRIEPSDVEMLETMTSMGGHVGLFVQRRRAETAAKASDALRAAITQSALDAVVAIDQAGHIVEFNPAAEQTFGYRREEAVGKAMVELIVPPELREAHRAGFRRHLETGEARILDRRIELTACDRSGRIFPIELSVTRIESSGPAMFTAHIRDISTRKAAERAMYESHEQFATIARTLQQSLLPPHLPDIDGVDLAACYLPASNGPEVGGDFYDVFERARGDWILVVGDVCGKGAPAAAVTALARYTIRAAAMQHSRPRAMLAMLNAALLRDPDAASCTAVIARVRRASDRTRLTVACGGHPLPRIRRSNGDVEVIGRFGTLLGVLEEVSVSDDSRELHVGDTLTLYTDGVTDARRGTEFFQEERLDAVLRELRSDADASATVHGIEGALREFTDEHFTDDIAILVARLNT